jgi:Winged helix DNA-binding domain
VIENALAEEGPLTRRQLRDRVAAAGVRTERQALVHILMLATLRGLTVRGPVAGREQAYVLARDWLGEPPRKLPDRDRALAELARRYLAGHGPASDRDLAKWAGLPLRDARAGLGAIASELERRDDGLVDLAGRPPPAELPQPRLLGSFEPLLLGWASREFLLHDVERLIAGGVFRPFALIRGRAVGTWTLADGNIELQPFGRLSRADRAALDADGHDVLRYLG